MKLHSLKRKLKVDCEPLVVRIIMSPDRPEYRSQFQSIERVDLVVIKPRKEEQGFKIEGNKERLEEVQSYIQLIVSKVEEMVGDEEFTLLSKYIQLLANDDTKKHISKIQQKHGVEFLIRDSSSQELLDVSAFCQRLFQNPQLKKQENGHQDEAAKHSALSESLMVSTKYEEAEMVNLQVHGLKKNLKLAVVDLKAALHIIM